MATIFAHRGLHDSQRENTVDAFLAARAAGADGVELDVRRCRGGELVVHHDPSIAGRALADTPYAELDDYVPTLAGALGACAGMVVNVEIKNSPADGAYYDATGDFARQVVDFLHLASWAQSCQVSCFDLATCRAVRAVDPAIYVGWLLAPGEDVAARLEAAVGAGLNALNPHYTGVDARLVAAAREARVELNVWTVNQPDDVKRMLVLGVDAVITDDPVGALALAGRPSGGRSPMA